MIIDKISHGEALSYLGYHGKKPDENTLLLLNKYEKQLLKTITPRYVYKLFETGVRFLKGKQIQEHIKNAWQVAVFAATIGIGADNLLRTAQVSDMAGAVVLDALMGACVETVCDAAEKEIAAKFPDCTLTTRFSPGYGDFPLEIQSDLLDELDALKRLGITISTGGMMNPTKSVTAVIGIKKRGE